MKTIWISWERHRRTKELANHFGITVYYLISRLPRIFKYPILIYKTYKIINKSRPEIVVVQNPSVILALICCLFKKIYNFRLVVDLHNGAIVPETELQKKLFFIYRYVHRNSDVNIVTNNNLKQKIEIPFNKTLVLPDRLPFFDDKICSPELIKGIGDYYVAISTFGIDEPYKEIIEAAGLLRDDIKIIITGNHLKCPRELKDNAPGNLLFSGFLPDDEYAGLLYNSRGVIDLTTRKDCLVCGAYESVSLGKPLVLSDTEVLRNYFYGGAVFCENDKYSICNAINEIEANYLFYQKKVLELKNEINSNWKKYEKPIKKIFDRVS